MSPKPSRRKILSNKWLWIIACALYVAWVRIGRRESPTEAAPPQVWNPPCASWVKHSPKTVEWYPTARYFAQTESTAGCKWMVPTEDSCGCWFAEDNATLVAYSVALKDDCKEVLKTLSARSEFKIQFYDESSGFESYAAYWTDGELRIGTNESGGGYCIARAKRYWPDEICFGLPLMSREFFDCFFGN